MGKEMERRLKKRGIENREGRKGGGRGRNEYKRGERQTKGKKTGSGMSRSGT